MFSARTADADAAAAAALMHFGRAATSRHSTVDSTANMELQ